MISFVGPLIAAQQHPGRAWAAAQHAANSGDVHGMLRFTTDALNAAPSFVPAIVLRGEALGEFGRLEEALHSFDSAVRMQPNDAQAYASMGNSLRRGGYWSANAPGMAAHRSAEAHAVAACPWWEPSIDMLRSATTLNPLDAQSYTSLAHVLAACGGRQGDDVRTAALTEARAARAEAARLLAASIVHVGESGSDGCAPDALEQCAGWAAQGECQRNPEYMKQQCRTSCGFCEPRDALPSTEDGRGSGGGGGSGSGAEADPRHVAHPAVRFRSSGRVTWLPLLRGGEGGSVFVSADSTRMLTFDTCCGWGNQWVMMAAAVDLAYQLNRTLVLPPFTPFKVQRSQGGDESYPQGRHVSWARFLDMRRLNALLPATALDAPVSEAIEGWRRHRRQRRRGAPPLRVGEARPPKVIHGQPRWDGFALDALRAGSADVDVLHLTTNLWGWLLSPVAESRVHSALRFSPHLTSLASELIGDAIHRTLERRAAAAQAGGGEGGGECSGEGGGKGGGEGGGEGVVGVVPYGALHVRRTDKATSQNYMDMWATLTPEHFGARLRQQGLGPGSLVFVATDEAGATWFAPLQREGYELLFASALDNERLSDELHNYPVEFWNDVVSLLEAIICVQASAFVGSLPSTVSGVIHNARAAAARQAAALDGHGPAVTAEAGAAGGGVGASSPDGHVDQYVYFQKVHHRCCDAATAAELAAHGTDDALHRVCGSMLRSGVVDNPYC